MTVKLMKPRYKEKRTILPWSKHPYGWCMKSLLKHVYLDIKHKNKSLSDNKLQFAAATMAMALCPEIDELLLQELPESTRETRINRIKQRIDKGTRADYEHEWPDLREPAIYELIGGLYAICRINSARVITFEDFRRVMEKVAPIFDYTQWQEQMNMVHSAGRTTPPRAEVAPNATPPPIQPTEDAAVVTSHRPHNSRVMQLRGIAAIIEMLDMMSAKDVSSVAALQILRDAELDVREMLRAHPLAPGGM